jgi:uncharacterized cupin superfamily protein
VTHAPMTSGDVELADDPIDQGWILEGEPRARAKTWAESADGTTCSWLWDCTAGSFRWWFGMDETVHIVEGSVTVQVDGEQPMTLGVGDAAYFPAGRWSTWTVEDYVRKHAVLRVPVPRSMAYLVNGFGRRKYAVK